MSRELMRAIFKEDIAKFDSLIESTDIYSTTPNEKWNLLHRALVSVVLKPSPVMVKRLIKLGLDVNGVDIYGNTPLHYAARTKNYEIVKMLLDEGSIVCHINNDGLSPLHFMLLDKPYEYSVIELLLKHGAFREQPNENCKDLKSFVEAIAHGQDSKLKDLIQEYS